MNHSFFSLISAKIKYLLVNQNIGNLKILIFKLTYNDWQSNKIII